MPVYNEKLGNIMTEPIELLKPCDEIRAENKRKWFPIWRVRCFFCYQFARGDVERLCVSSERGCPQVNKRYKLHEGQK